VPDYQIVIPARLASQRLPNKPLLDVEGKPLLQRVWDVGVSAGAKGVLIATEDHEIIDAVNGFGGRAVLTSSAHASGTDRLAEVVDSQGWSDETIVVNLQGDEPCIPVTQLAGLAVLLAQNPSAGIATMATPVRDVAEWFDPGVVKVVCSCDGRALYFSRAPIPWDRGAFDEGRRPNEMPPGVTPMRHLGMYAYRAKTLRQFAALPPSQLEMIERLEQLRALEAGIEIVVGRLEEPPGHGVDTPADLARIRAHFAARDE